MTTESSQLRFPYSDLVLSRRLEDAEGSSNRDFVETRARLDPSSGACSMHMGGVRAQFDGAGSPLTQTFGLGLFAPSSADELQTIEEFFESRGAEVFHEVSPLADGGTVGFLNARGYQPLELSSILFQPIAPAAAKTPANTGRVQVRIAERQEADRWAALAARGWAQPELTQFLESIGKIVAASEYGTSFFAEIDGQPVATAALSIHDGVALFAGASTVPEHRNQGAQLALLDFRMRHAAERGCDLATMGALPGSASQRNAERQGFRIAYTRTKWQLVRR
jgi:GNAT superfamily N-acetyltransferase